MLYDASWKQCLSCKVTAWASAANVRHRSNVDIVIIVNLYPPVSFANLSTWRGTGIIFVLPKTTRAPRPLHFRARLVHSCLDLLGRGKSLIPRFCRLDSLRSHYGLPKHLRSSLLVIRSLLVSIKHECERRDTSIRKIGGSSSSHAALLIFHQISSKVLGGSAFNILAVRCERIMDVQSWRWFSTFESQSKLGAGVLYHDQVIPDEIINDRWVLRCLFDSTRTLMIWLNDLSAWRTMGGSWCGLYIISLLLEWHTVQFLIPRKS